MDHKLLTGNVLLLADKLRKVLCDWIGQNESLKRIDTTEKYLHIVFQDQTIFCRYQEIKQDVVYLQDALNVSNKQQYIVGGY